MFAYFCAFCTQCTKIYEKVEKMLPSPSLLHFAQALMRSIKINKLFDLCVNVLEVEKQRIRGKKIVQKMLKGISFCYFLLLIKWRMYWYWMYLWWVCLCMFIICPRVLFHPDMLSLGINWNWAHSFVTYFTTHCICEHVFIPCQIQNWYFHLFHIFQNRCENCKFAQNIAVYVFGKD